MRGTLWCWHEGDSLVLETGNAREGGKEECGNQPGWGVCVEWSGRNLEKGVQVRQERCGCQAEEATFYHDSDGF